ncbi:hypothetical protein MML48_4g00012645 [Holotrichia oblita]|uniref:Uncharacterized protein n=1 Tax=Holotrichia oblita TaxID=644536 RepID=A0ACB9TA62_HOLOL|nr:hypothetical protein MML48_4g00012645 [Holotrichia oblita]
MPLQLEDGIMLLPNNVRGEDEEEDEVEEKGRGGGQQGDGEDEDDDCNDSGTWRIRYNFEIYQQFKEPPILQFVKLQRLRWAGHVVRIEEHRMERRVLEANVTGTRQVGRPRKWWQDEVAADAKRLMQSRNWKRDTKDRDGKEN